MRNKEISWSQNKADYLLSITAMSQSALAILQQYLIYALHMSEDYANQIRVFTTAVPILLSMIVVIKRDFKRVVFVYIPIILILLYTIIRWPSRWNVMSSDVLKFLLPVVIPTGLCVSSINNLKVFFKSAFYVSVVSLFLAILYMYSYFIGSVSIESYSMAFSYALLLPMVILMTQKNVIWKIASAFLLISIFAIGSRGALITAVLYFVVLYFWDKLTFGKLMLYGVLLGLGVFLLFDPIINIIANFLSSVGIESRSLYLLSEGEIISHNSGRDVIQDGARQLIENAPFLGNGVWADREYLNAYCHNIYLELIVDFGYFGGWLLIIVLLLFVLKTFNLLNKRHRLVLVMFIFSTLIPLLVSSSYLINYNLSMAIGVTFLLKKCSQKNIYQLADISS